MKRSLILISIILFVAFSITGCSTSGRSVRSVKTTTTVFHNLAEQGDAQSFTFLPNEDQKGSIEYAIYAQLISTNLQAYGWIQSDITNTSPEYLIFFEYFIDNGQVVSENIPIYGQTGGGTSYSSGSVYGSGGYATYSGTTYSSPSYGQIGSIPSTHRVYTRVLKLKIIDAEKSSPENPVIIFEGRVKSHGGTDDISRILPTLIKALFTEFPGESGESKSRALRLVR